MASGFNWNSMLPWMTTACFVFHTMCYYYFLYVSFIIYGRPLPLSNHRCSYYISNESNVLPRRTSSKGFQTARIMGPTWGPPGSGRLQVGPMYAPWTLLSGICSDTKRQRALFHLQIARHRGRCRGRLGLIGFLSNMNTPLRSYYSI